MSLNHGARMLAVYASGDTVLHHVAPLGLAAAAAGPALVIDLDPGAPSYPGVNVRELLDEGPRREHLVPGRAGVAVVGNGGVDAEAAWELVTAFARHWPTLVLRLPDRSQRVPSVPVRPLLPGPLAPRASGPAAYQRLLPGSALPGPGVGLPPLSRAAATSLLTGRVERRWRWVVAWRKAWETSWR